MARIRTIKPDFWTDEKVVELSFGARLLFIGLWNFADDSGRMVYSEKKYKMQIFPADEVVMSELVGEIRREKLVTVYEVDNIQYLQINGFDKHQKVDKRFPSKLPPPTHAHADSPRFPPTEWNGMEGRGRESKKEAKASQKVCVDLPDWLPPDLWQKFKAFRKEIKKPLGPVAEKSNIAKLERLRAEGNPPADVINQSIERGWQGLFQIGGDYGQEASGARLVVNGGAPMDPERAERLRQEAALM